MARIIFITLAAIYLSIASAQEKKLVEPPKPAQTPSQEMLSMWNRIGNKLVAMAEDFPEAKYGFKAQQDERTFGENLLHVTADDYEIVQVLKGIERGPLANEDSLKKMCTTKSSIVNILKQAVAEGAELIAQQGDSGLVREYKSPYSNKMLHPAISWISTIEHAGEHYGQLVVYYRLNDLIPPASRPKKK